MRTVSQSIDTVPQDNPAATSIHYVESADAADLQAKAQAVIDSQASALTLSFIDIAGGGDGHTFVMRLHFVNTVTGSGIGVPVEIANIFVYEASQAVALQEARRALQAQLAVLFDTLSQGSQLFVMQTVLAGAQKGTRFMGALITQSVNNC
jgi:hypothetical protein